MSTLSLSISLDTLVGASSLLGHGLEDRAPIREAQDRSLLRLVQACSTISLRDSSQQELFCVAPLDILVSEADGKKQFHLIEINGTGIGGLTNLCTEAVACVLEDLEQMARELDDPRSLVLVGVSGKEWDQNPRLNKLVHEKVLYAEALKRGFESRGLEARVTAMPALIRSPQAVVTDGPLVVVGYIKEFLDHLRLESNGRLSLFGRRVRAGVNDRFALNIIQKLGRGVDLGRFQIINRCFLAGADKGVAYGLLNDYLALPRRFFPDGVEFAVAADREELVQTVLDWVHSGRRTVIKPQGTGLGHGIEFFLDPREAREDIVARIDASLKLTEHYYRVPGGAFPYTVCEFIDTCTISRPEHPHFGHKYELRVVVYRDRKWLRAFPSIVKVSSQAYDPANPDHRSLINNITASSVARSAPGTEFMLPLCNRETLALLDLRVEHLKALCEFATGFIRHVLDQVQEEPGRFGLPPVSLRLPRALAAMGSTAA